MNNAILQANDGPMDLRRIKEVLVIKALAGNFLQPLRSFFKDMQLGWTDCGTAQAKKIGDLSMIELDRQFFAAQVQDYNEAADVVMHEIMHHLFAHLHIARQFQEQGYNDALQNVAEDAVINAYLHRIGCSGFATRYYEDEDEYAFLRPHSCVFKNTAGWFGKKRAVTLQLLGQSEQMEIRNFYEGLYRLGITLEKALEFFKKHFPKSAERQLLIGSHAGRAKSDGTKRGEKPQVESVFSNEEARAILDALHIMLPPQTARNNFAQVIQRITTAVNRPGNRRTGTTLSRRVPAKFSQRDIIRLEQGRDLFTRTIYKCKEVWIFMDISGSVAEYIPFVAGLVVSLRQSNLAVRAVCWANRIREAELMDLCKGLLPADLGSGTDGEVVAAFLVQEKIAQAIIITDNYAGKLETKIPSQVHVCLIGIFSKEGSFLDRAKVPHSHAHVLRL